jgi:glycosyltransferase involved in cell wall biosynthesis
VGELSVVICTKNEEKNIKACLESVKWADEIVIVDDISTDRTVEICRQYTGKIFFNDSKDAINDNKNLGAEKSSGDWVLSVDADELITPELAEEIKQAVDSQLYFAYYIPRKNYFLGKWIRGCDYYPDYIIRLYRKGAGSWPSGVHDVIRIKEKNKASHLKNPIIHNCYYSFNQYFAKFNRNTTRLAQEEYDKGIRINKVNFVLYFFIKPLFWFFLKYFYWRGLMDGFRGFFISCSSALVIFVTYAKLWEKENNINGIV